MNEYEAERNIRTRQQQHRGKIMLNELGIEYNKSFGDKLLDRL